jgi:hypothetical protein
MLIGQGTVGVAAIALEERTRLYRECFVQNVAFNVAGGAKQNLARPDAAFYTAPDRDFVSQYFALDDCLFADYQPCAMDVSFDAPVHLHIAGGR